MPEVIQHTALLTAQMDTGPDILDITAELDRILRESGIREGTLAATVVGSTGSLTMIEYEPGVVADLKDAIERLAPRGAVYAHEEAWHDGNGHSHVQAALAGTFPAPAGAGRPPAAGHLAAGGGHQPRQPFTPQAH